MELPSSLTNQKAIWNPQVRGRRLDARGRDSLLRLKGEVDLELTSEDPSRRSSSSQNGRRLVPLLYEDYYVLIYSFNAFASQGQQTEVKHRRSHVLRVCAICRS